jgi:hypothetical protein
LPRASYPTLCATQRGAGVTARPSTPAERRAQFVTLAGDFKRLGAILRAPRGGQWAAPTEAAVRRLGLVRCQRDARNAVWKKLGTNGIAQVACRCKRAESS